MIYICGAGSLRALSAAFSLTSASAVLWYKEGADFGVTKSTAGVYTLPQPLVSTHLLILAFPADCLFMQESE